MTDNKEIVEPRVDRLPAGPGEWWQRAGAGAVALILGLGTLWALKLLAWPLALLIGGVAFGAALAPVVSRLSQWLPRTVAIILIYLVILLFFAGLIWLIFPTLATEAQVVFQNAPGWLDQAQQAVNNWLPAGMEFSSLIPSASGGGSLLLSIPQQIIDWATAGVIVIFVSLYGLILSPGVNDFFLSLLPLGRRERAEAVLHRTLSAMGGYIRGTIIDALVVGVLTYLGLTLIGIRFAVVLSVLAALLEIIPAVGPIITAVLVVAVGLSQSTTKALLGLGFSILLQQLEGHILVPNIMRSQAHVSPLITVLAVFAGARIGGLVGALVAIPLVAGLRVLILEGVAPTVRDWTGAPPVEEDSED